MRQNDPIANHTRRARAKRRVGEDKRCACGESRAEALIPGSNPVVCTRCQRVKKEQNTTDKHHPAGQANDPTTIPIDVNDHRADLSVKQQDWEEPILENPNGCPVIAVAGRIRGFADTVIYLIEKLVDWIPPMLVALSAFLAKTLGAKWWIGTPLESFAPKT